MEHPVKALQLRCVENGAVYWTARTEECSLGNSPDCAIQIHINRVIPLSARPAPGSRVSWLLLLFRTMPFV